MLGRARSESHITYMEGKTDRGLNVPTALMMRWEIAVGRGCRHLGGEALVDIEERELSRESSGEGGGTLRRGVLDIVLMDP